MTQSENDPPERPSPAEERRVLQDTDAYFNQQFEDARPRYLEPGGFLCGDREKEMFIASVGSGVLVTMHDVELHLGGMTYVLLPPELLAVFPLFDKADPRWHQAALKPIEDCIAEMKHRGAGKHRIQIRLIGGGIMPGQDVPDAGTKNYIFVREYITRKGLTIVNEDLGGRHVRRVHFFPATGRAVRILLKRNSDFIAMQEFEKKIQTKK